MAKNVEEKVTRGAIGGDRVRPDHDFNLPQVYKVMSRIQETLEPFFVEEKKTTKKGKKLIYFSMDLVLLEMVSKAAKFKRMKKDEFILEALRDFLEDWENKVISEETLKKLAEARAEREYILNLLGVVTGENTVEYDEKIAEGLDRIKDFLKVSRRSFVIRMILDYHIAGMRKVFPDFDKICMMIENMRIGSKIEHIESVVKDQSLKWIINNEKIKETAIVKVR